MRINNSLCTPFDQCTRKITSNLAKKDCNEDLFYPCSDGKISFTVFFHFETNKYISSPNIGLQLALTTANIQKLQMKWKKKEEKNDTQSN